MIKRICCALFVLAVLPCLLSSPAAAQSSNSCLATTLWYFPDPIPSGWFYYGPGQGPFSYTIAAWKASCPPPGAGKETCPFCPKAGHPISLATGTTYIQQTDVKVPGLGGGLTLVRTWISQWPSTQAPFQVGLFGPNWRSTFEERVYMDSDNYLKYSRGDGSFWSFGTDGAAWRLSAPQNVAATLTSGSSYWTITFQNGEQRRFDNASGSLIAIIDRNGNTTSLSYDAANRLTTVTDAASRHLYFHYPDGSSRLVTSVTSDVGISLSYAYDAQSRLSQVTMPDLSTLSFAYDSQSLITSVTDSQGLVESHTYDSSGRGLTSSQANGVNGVIVSYPQ